MTGMAVKKQIELAQEFVAEAPDMTVLSSGRRDPPLLPREMFGSFWSKWIADAAEGAGAPVDYVAAGLIASAASVIGNSRAVTPWHPWIEPCILWVGLVGDPSSGKSPALDPTTEMIRKIEMEMAEGFDPLHSKWQETAARAKAERNQWEEEVKKATKSREETPPMPVTAVEPPEPSRPRLRAADATIEALAALLAGNARGLIYQRDEIAGWIGNMDRYGGAGGDRAFWIEAYGGRSYIVDRVKNTATDTIDRLSISLLAGVQPQAHNQCS